MIKILVTGGAGNIASALIAKLASNPANHIVIADNLLTGERAKVPDLPNVQFIKCDANDYNDIAPLFFANSFEYVFHFAAVVGVQRTLQNPLWVMHDIHGIEHVLNLSKNTGVRRVYYSSSSEVYGEPFEIPQNEQTTPLNSRLPYAIVKNVGEAFLRTYYKEFGLNYQVFRFFNTYGPNQSEDFVVPRFIRQAMANADITIYGDGSQTRTFCYVDDNVEACINAHHTGLFENDTINIGSDAECTIKELAETIIRVTGSSSKLINLPALTEGDMTRRKPDISKMRQLLNHDLVPLEEGIRRLAEHFEKTSDAA
jgi:nucleoside-diphosphate-sugar epimerase